MLEVGCVMLTLCDASLTTGSYATSWHVIYPVHESDALCVFGDESDHTHHIGSDSVLCLHQLCAHLGHGCALLCVAVGAAVCFS